jgi:hypothetical protein
MTAPTLTVTINEDHWVAWAEARYEEYVNYYENELHRKPYCATFERWFTTYLSDLMQQYIEDRTLLQ